MTTFTLDGLTRQTSSSAITFYQTWISPHKGFVCAHRVLHRGESCSQYAKRTILEAGLWQAIPLIQERFEDCKVANEILKARRERQHNLQRWRCLPIEPQEPLPNPDALPDVEAVLPDLSAEATATLPQKRPCHDQSCHSFDCQNADCSSALDCASALGEGANCGSDCVTFEWRGFDCGNLDCGLSDCSALDCGSLDCGFLDCGSCG